MQWYFVYHWHDGVESYPYSHTVGPAATEAEARELLVRVLERTQPDPNCTYHIKYGYPLATQTPATDDAAQEGEEGMIRPVPEPGTPGNPVHLGVGGTPVYTPNPTRDLSREEVIAIQRRFTSMTVRAKFYVTEVKQSRNHYGGQEGELLTTIKLAPVVGTSEENKAFFRWTPSGTIDLGTVNPTVVEQMHIGDEFYVDFTPVPQKPAD